MKSRRPVPSPVSLTPDPGQGRPGAQIHLNGARYGRAGQQAAYHKQFALRRKRVYFLELFFLQHFACQTIPPQVFSQVIFLDSELLDLPIAHVDIQHPAMKSACHIALLLSGLESRCSTHPKTQTLIC